MRIAMVGAGGVAARHVRVLTGLGARVVAVADPVADAARRLAGDCGAAAYPDVDAALDAGPVDAVYVCVPPFAHGAPERAVLARGLPLFVEKPLSVDRDTAEQLAAEVERAGVVTGTGYHWRCLDTVQRAAELLAESPARLAVGSWLDKVPPPPWWTSRAESSPGDVDDVTAVAARFRGGAVGTLAASALLPAKRRAELETVSAGGLRLEVSEQRLVIERPGADPEVLTPRVDGHEAVDREFLDAVAGIREATRAPYGQALRTHLAGLAVAESAATGKPVTL